MSTAPGVNATFPRTTATAASSGGRVEESAQDAVGFAALLSCAEADVEKERPALPPDTTAAPPSGEAISREPALLQSALPHPGAPAPAEPVAPDAETASVQRGARSMELAAMQPQAQAAADASGAWAEAVPIAQEAAQPAGSLLQQAALARRADAQRARVAAAVADASAELRARADQPALALAPQQVASPAASTAPAVLAAAWLAGSGEGLRGWRQRDEKTSSSSTATPVTGGDSVQAGSGAAAASGASTLPVPAAAPDGALLTEQRVAEQVSYWVRRGVHNAELELDGLDDGAAVQVHIALQGQQARVEFRADLAQTRQLLEDSMPHLRELLAREGLVLADVSVGGHGGEHGQRGAGSQDGRAGARRTLAVEVPAAAAVARPGGGMGRTLDLYV